MNLLDTSKLANEIAVILNNHLESHIHDTNETERILMQLPIVRKIILENSNLKKKINENANNVTLEIKEVMSIVEKKLVSLSNTTDRNIVNVNLMKKGDDEDEGKDEGKDEGEGDDEDEGEGDDEDEGDDEGEDEGDDEGDDEVITTANGSLSITLENNEVQRTDKRQEKYVETDVETEAGVETEAETEAEVKEEVEEEEHLEDCDEDEELLVDEIEINDRIYYKDENYIIYNQDIDGDPGDAIGYYNEQKEPIFY